MSAFPRMRFLLALAAASLLTGPRLFAERSPAVTYTIKDGLPHDHVTRIVADSSGFLWFCTREGVARFDGRRFNRYEHTSLAGRIVNDILEQRPGTFWIATASGLVRFNGLDLAEFNPGGATAAFFDLADGGDQTIWCATSAGLQKLDRRTGRFQRVPLSLPTDNSYNALIGALLRSRDGDLFAGTASGLFRLRDDRQVDRYLTRSNVLALLQDRGGRVWVGTTLGLFCLAPAQSGDGWNVERSFTKKDGLPSDYVSALLEADDGTLWIGTARGLIRLDIATGTFSGVASLTEESILTLRDDREGNIWVGTESGGSIELIRSGLTTYAESDGLREPRIAAIFEDRQGHLCVLSSNATVHTFDGVGFGAARANLPSTVTDRGWGWYQTWLQDRSGDWWIPTGQGLFRFPPATHPSELARSRPKAVYTTAEGLYSNYIFRLFEDRRGDIWISVLDRPLKVLCRWERATNRIHRYEDPRFFGESAPSAFAEDSAGNLWIGSYEGDLVRLKAGTFRKFGAADGVPPGMIRGMHRDQRGRLWVATSRGGAMRIDNPDGDRLRFAVYNTATGLGSNQVLAVTEDRAGRIYFGTGRGFDQLDPATGSIRHFTAADGLPNNVVNVAYRDLTGSVWFGTLSGLARLNPDSVRVSKPPPQVVISGVRVSGTSRRVSDLGAVALPALELGPHDNHVEIDFVTPTFRLGAAPRYQYRLEGARNDEWSEPRDGRSVTYANLSPGHYRFAVRVVDPEGLMSSTPASVVFSIAPALWRRWWFIAAVFLLTAAMAYALHRYRLRRELELERVRTRIASDLHDDIGASLSRMAILSEVVRRQIGDSGGGAAKTLSQIADSARDLVDSMSDIVWSVNPRHDDLHSVVLRIRQFASDVLEPKHISWSFDVPKVNSESLTPEQRRHIYLFFKEAINNTVRHAGCASVALAMDIRHRQLHAEVRDDGHGFEVNEVADGSRHGLASMRSRAAELGGSFLIESSASGTSVRFTIPIRHWGA